MIQSFGDKDAARLLKLQASKRLSRDIERAAQRKLMMLNAAESLDDLKALPGNRLEKLKGDRKGQYSIRINDQYRICFTWRDGHAHGVEIVDYH